MSRLCGSPLTGNERSSATNLKRGPSQIFSAAMGEDVEVVPGPTKEELRQTLTGLKLTLENSRTKANIAKHKIGLAQDSCIKAGMQALAQDYAETAHTLIRQLAMLGGANQAAQQTRDGAGSVLPLSFSNLEIPSSKQLTALQEITKLSPLQREVLAGEGTADWEAEKQVILQKLE